MSRFLVTGGAGFIGSHIVERLLKEGYFVRVLDNLSSGKRENLGLNNKNLEFIEGDICNKDICLKAAQGIDYISHQAALRSVPKSLENPNRYNEVNINGTLNMLEAALQHEAKSFVFASSSSIYGDCDKFPQKEDAYPKIISPYALTKLAGESYCRIFYKIYGLNTVSLRYFNIFGPRQALDDDYSAVIPKFINCILKDESPPVHGDGKQTRDFTFVDNAVEANLLASARKDLNGEVVNVANQKEYSVLDLVKLINKIENRQIKPKFSPFRKGDVVRTLADISKAKRVLNYHPLIDFEDGLKLTINWFKS